MAQQLTCLNKNITIMADNKTKIGKPDRDRISLSEDYEVQGWSKKFGISPEELKKAVKTSWLKCEEGGNVSKEG